MREGRTRVTGREIHRLRRRFLLTQEALARLLDVATATVNRWEAETASPRGMSGIVLTAMRQGVDRDPRLPDKIDSRDRISMLAAIFATAASARGKR